LKSSQSRHSDFLEKLVRTAQRTVASGYYKVDREEVPRRSLKRSISESKIVPIITEIKFVSPAEGKLRVTSDVAGISRSLERGGAVGISVLTEPEYFNGRLIYLPLVKKSVSVPVLMKDIVVDPIQIEAADHLGADAILLIVSIYRNRHVNRDLNEMIDQAHSRKLEVLLEVHTAREYDESMGMNADLIGINNRNLDTLEVSLETSVNLLRDHGRSKPVVCESGIKTKEEIDFLRRLGADAFLVGSSIMKSEDVEAKVRSLTGV
jgi:indole-3-glycerol phosphate synthase